MDDREKKKKRSRAAAATALAAVTSAGIVMGGAFQSPEELLHGGEEDDAPLPLVETLRPEALASDSDGAGDADEDTDENEEEKRRSPRARFRAWVWRQPLALRAAVGVPLWALGWLLLTGLGALWSGILSPIGQTILSWAATAAVLLGAFALTAKAAFPDLPLKKIVNKRSFSALLIGAGVLAVLNAVLPLVWEDYSRVAELVRALGSAGLLGGVTAFFLRREKKRRTKASEPPEKEEERPLTQADALQFARELVDEVSPRRV